MLTERLRAALTLAERLPPEAQDALAAQIEGVLRDTLWNAVMNGPQPTEMMRQITQEADTTGALPFPTQEVQAVTPWPPTLDGKEG
jgi:uncharacterized protein (DUF2267 family)